MTLNCRDLRLPYADSSTSSTLLLIGSQWGGPPGSGERIGLDRDGDGSWEGDEQRTHTDPAGPDSRP